MKRAIKCFLLAAVFVLSICISSTSAAELFSSQYPKYWATQNSHGQALLKYTNYNLTSHYSAVTTSVIGTASGRWAVTADGYARVVASQASSSESHRVYHVASTPSFWYSLNNNNMTLANSYAAITRPFDTSGSEMTGSNYRIRTAGINGANVYYPDSDWGTYTISASEINLFAIQTTAVKTTIIAHEAGHALGFGYYESESTIMRESISTMSSTLTDYDKNCLAAKYPYS